MLVVQRVFGAKRTNLHEKYDYPGSQCRHQIGGIELIRLRPKAKELVREHELRSRLVDQRGKAQQASGVCAANQDVSIADLKVGFRAQRVGQLLVLAWREGVSVDATDFEYTPFAIACWLRVALR